MKYLKVVVKWVVLVVVSTAIVKGVVTLALTVL